MITPAYAPTATERVLPRLALDFTTAIADPRVTTSRAANTATRFNASGLIEIVNANLPRFDFSPTALTCLGQLIEEARTNLFLNSLIDGTNLATQSVTLSAVTYTLSFYGSGSVAISGGHSATVNGIGDFPNRKTYTFTPTAGSSTFTISGDVKFAQLEAGAFATSYIPTTTTSVTRNADVVSMTGTNFSSWYNASEGSLQTVSSPINALPIYGAATLALDNNNFAAFFFVDVNKPRLLVRNAGVYDVNTAASAAQTAPFNQIMALKNGSISFASNGILIVNSANKNIPSPTSLQIGYYPVVNIYANAHISRISYWPQRLTNNEVIAFSK